MAKKQPKPIFPLKHEFYASLDNYIIAAGMLADTVRQLLSLPEVITNELAREQLQARLDIFAMARGDQKDE